MFRPNIRGVPRRGLRLGLSGWRDTNSDLLIRHRLPWRSSWTARLSAEPNLRPMLSRSGLVFLISNESAQNIRQERDKSVPHKSKLVFAALVALIFSVIMTLAIGSPRPHTKTQPDNQANASTSSGSATPLGCESTLVEPQKQIEAWIGGEQSSRLEITELQRQQIGGVQSRVIRVGCEAKSAVLQLTLVLQEKTWTLKKFARLEN